ncbi:MAG: 16S rRNA (uracil(1498)-N(3))-methyltransferase [Epsilonproteobacteria bacterium]|nr:MAG: 16S rRNA (uracil(1498)-N(3))-methyltransferase [Campylobacterota bacterium]
MQFTYHKHSGDEYIVVDGDLHKYLFKVRRHSKEKNLFFRNLDDNNIYEYKIINSGRRDTQFQLISSKELILKQSNSLHIGWCIVDSKTIEKVLASLNELGVEKISFIYCTYSQKQFKLNFEKLTKILINSSQQCGRSDLMTLETYDSLDEFINDYPDTYMFNFSTNHIDNIKNDIKTIVIGCEGGFSDDEITQISPDKIVGINSNLILRSETATVSVASKILI